MSTFVWGSIPEGEGCNTEGFVLVPWAFDFLCILPLHVCTDQANSLVNMVLKIYPIYNELHVGFFQEIEKERSNTLVIFFCSLKEGKFAGIVNNHEFLEQGFNDFTGPCTRNYVQMLDCILW